MLRLAAIAALALLGSTPYWLTVGGIDSSGNQHALLVNDAGQVQLTMAGKLATVQLSAVDAGQPFWNLLGGIDYVGNQYPVVGGIGKSAYLITNTSGTVLTHVNATDLNSGTALVGGAWTLNGAVPYNATASPRPAVGPFTSSNYFSQPSSSPANVGAPPFTIVVVANPTSFAAGNNGFFLGGWDGSKGYFINLTSSACSVLTSNTDVSTAAGMTIGATNIVIAGVDASGTTYIQLNGGTTGSQTGTYISPSGNSVDAYIGIYGTYGGSTPLNGNIYEVMVSTAVPSGAAFTALYNSIIAAE